MAAVQETVDRVRQIDVDQYRYGFVTDIESETIPIGLDEGVERERSPRFALAPAAMAAMDEQWLRLQPVADGAAGTAAFEREL